MSDFLNRSFSRREKLLMLLLVIVVLVGLYFYLVHYPITQRLDEIEQETDDVLLQQDVANTRLEMYNEMKEELAIVDAMPKDEVTILPEYDNIQTLMNMFNVIFAGTQQTLTFDNVRINNNNVAERTMRFSFTARDYDHARQVLANLTGTGYRCLLDSLSFAATDGNVETGTLRVTGNITFYEKMPS